MFPEETAQDRRPLANAHPAPPPLHAACEAPEVLSCSEREVLRSLLAWSVDSGRAAGPAHAPRASTPAAVWEAEEQQERDGLVPLSSSGGRLRVCELHPALQRSRLVVRFVEEGDAASFAARARKELAERLESDALLGRIDLLKRELDEARMRHAEDWAAISATLDLERERVRVLGAEADVLRHQCREAAEERQVLLQKLAEAERVAASLRDMLGGRIVQTALKAANELNAHPRLKRAVTKLAQLSKKVLSP
jgi:hypothetical protein